MTTTTRGRGPGTRGRGSTGQQRRASGTTRTGTAGSSANRTRRPRTGNARTGTARTGTARTGTARTGTARTGTARTANARTGTARSGATSRRPAAPGSSGPRPESVLVGSVAVLCLLGLVMVYSASSVASVQGGSSSWSVVVRQAVFMALGLAIAFVASRIRPRIWRDRLATPVLVVAAALQAVLAADVALRALGGAGLPVAVSVNGATRWIGVGPFVGQPSDLLKLGLVLWLARLLDVRHREIGSPELIKPIVVVLGVLGLLVMSGDDLGTTLLLGVIVVTMLFLAGAPLRQVGAIGGAGLVAGLAAIVFLEGFRLQRIAAFLSPGDHLATSGYQLLQSQIGFASGGVFGNGPGNSRAKWGYLPEADTDFILAVIGEELGLIGSLVVLGAFLAFMGAGVAIALKSRSRFGRLAAFGLTTWIGVQALINIGVSIGTLPTKGITLPFVSYGGSSLMMCMAAVGILVSIAHDR